MRRIIVIRRDYLHYVRKFKRFEKRHTSLQAHCSPCLALPRPFDRSWSPDPKPYPILASMPKFYLIAIAIEYLCPIEFKQRWHIYRANKGTSSTALGNTWGDQRRRVGISLDSCQFWGSTAKSQVNLSPLLVPKIGADNRTSLRIGLY